MDDIKMSPTGKLVQGHVLDVNKKHLEHALKRYDEQLYLRWNPKKQQGWGMWEVRRLPSELTAIEVAKFEGVTYKVLVYWENDITSHILDVPYLNYDVLNTLKRIDTWRTSDRGQDFAKNLDYNSEKYEDAQFRRNQEEMRYTLRHNKKLIRDFKEAIRDGYNPLDFFRGRYKS